MTRDTYQSSKDELYIIGESLTEVEMRGLLAEFIWSFGNARAEGLNTDRACAVALNEWDL